MKRQSTVDDVNHNTNHRKMRLSDKERQLQTGFHESHRREVARHIKFDYFKLATFAPLDSKRFAPESASWSILSHTIPEVFQISLPDHNLLNNSEPTIDSLGIAPIDIEQLHKILLFPEDPANALLSVTIGYLLQANISENTLSIILDYLAHFSGFANCSQSLFTAIKIPNVPIYEDIQMNLFKDFHVHQFLYPELLTKSMDRSVINWGEVAKISEQKVIEHFRFTVQGLNVIKYLWQLKYRAYKIHDAILAGLPIGTYCEFGLLVDTFLKMIVKNDREMCVLKGRLGMLDGREWTLEELGIREHLTRERIRQIEMKLMSILKKPKILNKLSFMWLVVSEMLLTGGGVLCVTEIAESMKDRWKWTSLPPNEALASFIGLSADYKVISVHPIRIILSDHVCVQCTKIISALARAVESQTNGMLLFDDAVVLMHHFCQSEECKISPDILKFSDGYLHFLDDLTEEIIADENAFYTRNAWNLKYKQSRILLVETILRATGRPMHFKEIHTKLNENRPVYEHFSERNVYSYIERSSNLLLWDRGTYIHRDYVSIPADLMESIEAEIISRLNSPDIPYLSISGIFELFKNDLLKKNVPSESAFYSCLRESNNEELSFPEYPYVRKKGIDTERLPIPLVLEEYVLNLERVVTLKELRDYAVETLCINEQLFNFHLQNTPNLFRINRGEFIHLNQLEIDEARLAPIIEHLKTLLSTASHISVIKAYNDKKITCRLLNIPTPWLLFSTINHFYSDEFQALRYPKICLSSHTSEKDRSTGIASEVIHYITQKGVPCSFAELYQHFVNELGYNQVSVYNVHYKSDVFRYSEGVVVHLNSLEWTDEKQIALEMLAVSHLNNRQNAGKPFGFILHLYDYMHDQLPKIPDRISWTPTLIGELLSRSGRYRVIGTLRNAFVSIPNSKGIESLDDLIYYILDSDYGGAENINQFISDMCEAGIIKKRLTAMMLGANSRVVIEGNVIRLARLK